MRLSVEPDTIYPHVLPVDFRKSIHGLLCIEESELELNAFTGALFLFSNKKRDKLIIQHWEKTGFALWYKRLEKHKFKWTNEHELS